MKAIIKSHMKKADYKAFETDYDYLFCIKSSVLWNKTIADRNKSIYIKPHFERLKDKYSYSEYKESIYKDMAIKSKVQAEINENGLSSGDCLYIHYTIQLYIAFIVEYIIKQEIESNYRIKCYSNNLLDNEKKTDILCGGRNYQIKNSSFIDNNRNTDRYIKDYEKSKDYLLFIFYTIEKDDIYFLEICGKPFLSYNDINGFTALQSRKNIAISELTEAMAATAL